MSEEKRRARDALSGDGLDDGVINDELLLLAGVEVSVGGDKSSVKLITGMLEEAVSGMDDD